MVLTVSDLCPGAKEEATLVSGKGYVTRWFFVSRSSREESRQLAAGLKLNCVRYVIYFLRKHI